MSYLLDTDSTEGSFIFIVGLSTEKVEFKESKLKFLSGLGYAIYVAAYDLDDEEKEENIDSNELDAKAFVPRPMVSSKSLANFRQSPSSTLPALKDYGSRKNSDSSLAQAGLSIDSPDTVENRFSNFTMDSQEQQEAVASAVHDTLLRFPELRDVGIAADSAEGGTKERSRSTGTPRAVFMSDVVQVSNDMDEQQPLSLPTVQEGDASSIGTEKVDSLGQDLRESQKISAELAPAPVEQPQVHLNAYLPTWEPVAEFNFPVAQIPVKIDLVDNLTFSSFSDITHLADGSNANVFLAKFRQQKVVVKMIKSEVQNDSVAMHEFDLEHGMLARLSHPNIIKVLGSGHVPRRFIVLEYLGGGSLNSLLSQHQTKPGLAQRLFRKPSFTYATLLERAKEMAEALDYLHFRCYPGATIIHRGTDTFSISLTRFLASHSLSIFSLSHSLSHSLTLSLLTFSLLSLTASFSLSLP